VNGTDKDMRLLAEKAAILKSGTTAIQYYSKTLELAANEKVLDNNAKQKLTTV